MSELFDEVDEEVRREQLKKLWDNYSLYIIAAAILIIAAVGGWRGYQYLEAKKAAEASATFNRAVELSEQGKHEEAEKAFADLAATAPFGYRLLSRFRQAGELAPRDPKAAAKMFDDLAADSSIGPLQQELSFWSVIANLPWISPKPCRSLANCSRAKPFDVKRFDALNLR